MEEQYPQHANIRPFVSANEHRTVDISRWTISRAVFVTGILSVLPALAITGVISAFLGVYSFLLIPVIVGMSVWLINGRQRSGAQIAPGRAMLDARLAAKDSFRINGEPMIIDSSPRIMIASSIPRGVHDDV